MTIIGAVLLVAGLAAPAAATPLDCERSILKESTRLLRVRTSALRACEDRKLRGALPASTACASEPRTAATIAKAESKLRKTLARRCGGPDRTCGTPDDEPLAGIGWPGTCPDLQGGGCDNTIAGCDDIADCLTCVDAGAVDRALGLAYDALAPATDDAVRTCQRALGKETARLFQATTTALRRCWDGRLKGRHTNPCPSPGDGKAAPAIAKAASKARARICRACGGSDRACGGDDDLTRSIIGFPEVCPALDRCGGPIADLDGLATCLECIAGFGTGCALPIAVPSVAPYPAPCAAVSGCPRTLQLDGEADALDLDLGFTGHAHDLGAPWLGRLSLAIFGCVGLGDPTCGVCAVGGPITNAGGAATATRRCRNAPWVDCGTDADCAGAEGPCTFFLGPPQPIAEGGVSSCVLTEIAGPVTGTLNVETGDVAATLPTATRLYPFAAVGFPAFDDPCPQCVAGVCNAGARAGFTCTVQGASTAFGDEVSLDCPPTQPAFPAAELRFTAPLASAPQLVTTSAASPACTAPGFPTARCLCNTCDDAQATACLTDAECPETSPGVVGICGGKRCLGGTVDGTPCGAHSDCDGAPCGTPGALTRPNDCSAGICSAIAADEGVCAAGPFDGLCGPVETFRPCVFDSDCPVPGDTCGFVGRACYTDNGLVGGDVTATGSADPPTGGSSTARLAGLFCVPPSHTAFDDVRGLPGLGRVEVGVTTLLVP